MNKTNTTLILQLMAISTYCSSEMDQTNKTNISLDSLLDTPCLLTTYDSTDTLSLSNQAAHGDIDYFKQFRRQDLTALVGKKPIYPAIVKYNQESEKHMLDMLILKYPQYYSSLPTPASRSDIYNAYHQAIESEIKQ